MGAKLVDVPGVGPKTKQHLEAAGVLTADQLLDKFKHLAAAGMRVQDHLNEFTDWLFAQRAAPSCIARITVAMALRVYTRDEVRVGTGPASVPAPPAAPVPTTAEGQDAPAVTARMADHSLRSARAAATGGAATGGAAVSDCDAASPAVAAPTPAHGTARSTLAMCYQAFLDFKRSHAVVDGKFYIVHNSRVVDCPQDSVSDALELLQVVEERGGKVNWKALLIMEAGNERGQLRSSHAQLRVAAPPATAYVESTTLTAKAARWLSTAFARKST